jgi:hypothetical protein
MNSGLSPDAQKVLRERLRICEEHDLHEGTAFFKDALDKWDQAEYQKWFRIDDLSAHPTTKLELEEFRRQGVTGLGEKDMLP